MKIIVFCLPGLGDALLFTPALRLLRRQYPNAEIVALTMFPAVRDALATNPDLSSVRYFPFRKSSPWSALPEVFRLRRQRFDVSITPFPAYRKEYHLLSFGVGARQRIAHRFPSGFFSELTFLNTATVPADPTLHNAENSAKLLEPLGIEVNWDELRRLPLTLTLTSEDEQTALDLVVREHLEGKPLLGIHPGSINYRSAEHKRWPPEQFGAFADLVAREFGSHTVIFEGPSEAGLGMKVAAAMRSSATIIREVPIRTAAALIRRCQLFLSNDSGLMHVAAAMQRPVIAVFGPTDPRWVYPWAAPHRLIRAVPASQPPYIYTMREIPTLPALANLPASGVFRDSQTFIAESFAKPLPRTPPAQPKPSAKKLEGPKRILFLNWRDWQRPKAGGAEWVTRKLSQEWQSRGARVTLFTALYPGAKPEETLDGIAIVRRGQQRSVHLAAWRWLRHHQDDFDLIVDEINTIPFLAPWHARAPVVAYINQLAREAWFAETLPPISWVGYLLEPLALRSYRNTRTLTLSASTERDLRRIGFRRVTIFPVAATIDPPQSPPPKTPAPTFVTLGRLTPSKNLPDALRAFAIVQERFPSAKLWIIGRGDSGYVGQLQRLARELRIGAAVTFCGFISDNEKVDRLARAWALIAPSRREGWGLMVTDAGVCGTPAIGYDVPGLRDSIVDGVTGIRCPVGDVSALAEACLRIAADPTHRDQLGRAAREYGRSHSWEEAGEITWEVLRQAYVEG